MLRCRRWLLCSEGSHYWILRSAGADAAARVSVAKQPSRARGRTEEAQINKISRKPYCAFTLKYEAAGSAALADATTRSHLFPRDFAYFASFSLIFI